MSRIPKSPCVSSVTGDRFWNCPQIDQGVLRRLIDRYGRELVIVHGDATGVDESFGRAAKGLGLSVEPHPADWDRLGKGAGSQAERRDGRGWGGPLHRGPPVRLQLERQEGLCEAGDLGGDTDLPE
jgi:hypothetical protein